MSSWDLKLEKRLSALADTASKESLQTLAKWMSFNRKHGDAFCSCLSRAFDNATDARKWLYWQLIHQTLIMEKENPTKWDRLEELRVNLGEKVVIPALKKANSEISIKVKALVQDWDEMNVFGATLHNQIKRILASSPQGQPKHTGTVDQAAEVSTGQPTESNRGAPQDPKLTEAPLEENQKLGKSAGEGDEPKRNSIVAIDFANETIPEGKVEPREFADPVKLVATLQITRDLRSDSTVQYPALMSSVPLNIRKMCQQYLADHVSELGESEIQDYSLRLPSAVLDLDIDEAVDNVRTFREILKKLKASRERLLYLLIKSRCKFGAAESAAAFYGLEELDTSLKTRKELLTDAMDLEGMEVDRSKEIQSRDFEPFPWHDNEDSERDAKRQKI